MRKNGRGSFKEEDVVRERIDHLIEDRLPWLLVGLLGGLVVTWIVSKYEIIMAADVRLAFFMPVIVYLSGALGMQTETIYVRELAERKTFKLARYVFKESMVGFGLGLITWAVFILLSVYWLESFEIGLAVGVTMLINLTIAPVLAILVPNMIYRRHADPALGAGPIATIIQDLISLLVYFTVVSIIIFS